MHKALNTIFTLLLLSVFSQAFAIDFSIGEPDQIITEPMMAKSRAKAVANSQHLLRQPDDVVAGNPEGKVTLVQFVDFLCPLSEKMDPNIQALIKANPDLRVVYKTYPLRGKISKDAAEAKIASNNHRKYLPYHVALMQEGNTLTDAKIISLAKAQGLD